MWALIALISRKVFLKCKSRCKSKRARNKSAGLCTGLFEVSVQTVYFLLLEFFVEGGIDAKRDRDVFVAHLVAGGHAWICNKGLFNEPSAESFPP